MKNNFFIWILFLFVSCNSLSLLNAGVKNPKAESIEDQRRFLARYQLNDEMSTVIPFESLTPVIYNGFTPTSVYVFDKKGNNLKLPGATNKCAPEPRFFIEGLDAKKYYNKSNDFPLDSIKKWVRTMDFKNIELMDQCDFYVFITWAIWTGHKVFERDIQTCIQSAQKNNKAKIHVTLLNLDMQEQWGKENLEKVSFTKTAMNVRY
jgi:hypothetical protein